MVYVSKFRDLTNSTGFLTVTRSVTSLQYMLQLRVDVFLRAKAECFARLCHRLGVCLSVCHTRDLYQKGAS